MPLAQARHERLRKRVALAVFSSDALSSVAYATEEILLILVLAGTAALHYSVPIALAITALLAIVAISYQQTIHAYPSGGGSYIVARENLGAVPGLVAAAALLVDYVLTVSVSVAAGVAAVTSAMPHLAEHKVAIGVGCVAAIALANIRGVRESGRIFAVPTYFFIVSFGLLLAEGFYRLASGSLPATPPPDIPAVEALTWFLILRAFASGCTAMTGIEAISNGIPAFRPPEARNAAITLGRMTVLLVIFGGETHALIPLYAVGVFISFTLSQSGMVRHWMRHRQPGWRHHAVINGTGAVATGIVTVVIGATKFTHGAWIVVLVIPTLVATFMAMRRHYDDVAEQLSLEGLAAPPELRHTVLIIVGDLHRGVVRAVQYAKTLAAPIVAVRAVFVETDPAKTAKLEEKWARWGLGVPLVILNSPYRSLLRPLVEYLDALQAQGDDHMVTVVIPEFLPSKWWQHVLHNQTALLVKGTLLFRKNTVVVDVPYLLKR